MKKFIFLLVIIFGTTGINAQNRLICETDAGSLNMEEYYLNTLFERDIVLQKLYNGVEWLPIQVHILLRDDGTGSNPLNKLQWELDTLDARFSRGNIRFFQCAPINYIKNTTLYNSFYNSNQTHVCNGTTAEYQLCTANNVPNVINIYLIDSSNTSHAHFPSDRTSNCADWIILNKAQLQWYGVLAHEMGHYLDLLHTFNGQRRAANREHITRDAQNACYNCTTVGDLLCDTEADPDTLSSGSWTHPACTFTMTTRDTSCGNGLFTPSSENIMSYSVTCSHFFTNGQFNRMKAAIASSRSYLECNKLSDCSTNVVLSGVPLVTVRYYQASNSITSSADLQFGSFINYDAGNYITLAPGFKSSPYGTNHFSAFIDGCYGDVIFNRSTQPKDTTIRINIVPTQYSVQSLLITNLPGNQLFELFVYEQNGREVYKKTFRNFSKAEPVPFYHHDPTKVLQLVKVFNAQHQLIFEGPVLPNSTVKK